MLRKAIAKANFLGVFLFFDRFQSFFNFLHHLKLPHYLKGFSRASLELGLYQILEVQLFSEFHLMIK
jgi:hypothetical protein